MVVCTSCSARNEDAERFCGQCGAYLEWEGERVDAAPLPAPAQVPASSLIEASTASAGPGEAAPGTSTPATMSAAPAPAATSPSVPPAAAQPSGTAWSPTWSTTASPEPESSTSGAAPTGFGISQPTGPLEPPAPPPPPPVDDEPPPAPGDLICGRCGTGNLPTRKFCRRCGNDLTDAPVAVRPPSWRRLLRRRPKSAMVAGTRPARRRRRLRLPRRALVLLVVLAVVGAGAWFGRDTARGVYETVLDRAQVEAVQSTGVGATVEVPGQEAQLATDGTTDRSWSPGPPDTAPGQSLTLTFDEPFRLVRVLVTPGASQRQEQFLLQARPRDVVIQATGSDGTVRSAEFRLPDEVGARPLPLVVDDVTAVTVVIDSVYPAQDPAAPVAVGEVEVFGRR